MRCSEKLFSSADMGHREFHPDLGVLRDLTGNRCHTRDVRLIWGDLLQASGLGLWGWRTFCVAVFGKEVSARPRGYQSRGEDRFLNEVCGRNGIMQCSVAGFNAEM